MLLIPYEPAEFDRIRVEHYLSQKEIADVAKVTKQTVSNYCSGKINLCKDSTAIYLSMVLDMMIES